MSVEYPPEINSEAPREPSDTEVRVVHRAEVFKRAALITFAILVLYLAIVASIGVTLIRATQVSNHTLLDTINDCTNKSGKCFAQGQRRLVRFGDTVDHGSQRSASAAAACAASIPDPTYRAVLRCVHRTLTADRAKR